MAAAPPTAAQFMSTLLNAVRDLTGRRPPPTWTHVEKVQSRMATGNTNAVDAAIRLAVSRGWLRADGEPASSITLTAEGIKLIEPKVDPKLSPGR